MSAKKPQNRLFGNARAIRIVDAPFPRPTSATRQNRKGNEDRQKYFILLDQLVQIYAPINQESMNLVRQIAIARWQIERLHTVGEPSTVVEELQDTEAQARAAESLFSGPSSVERMSRQMDRLEIRTARLRRGIRDIHTHFPNIAKPIENKPLPKETKEPEAKTEPTVYITETDPEVLAAYRREFPKHKIVRLPADDVAKGIDIEDHLPPAPRKGT